MSGEKVFPRNKKKKIKWVQQCVPFDGWQSAPGLNDELFQKRSQDNFNQKKPEQSPN